MSCDVCRGHWLNSACPCCGESPEECPECGGTRTDYQLFDIVSREFLSCSKEEYLAAPDGEDEAEEQGERLCKYTMVCEHCKGSGYVS